MSDLLTINAKVDEQSIRDFQKAMSRFTDEVGNSQANAVRRGVAALIRSLRARTKQTKKKVSPLAIRKVDPAQGDKLPKWIRDKKSGHAYRRFVMTRPNRKGGAMRKYYYAADTRGEVRRNYGGIRKWGAAKKSWAKFFATVLNRSEPGGGNPSVRIPDKVTTGYFKEIVTGGNPRVEALLVNDLYYICDAITPGDVDAAMQAATNSINTMINEGIAKKQKELNL